jgi:hypothetical protein
MELEEESMEVKIIVKQKMDKLILLEKLIQKQEKLSKV